MWRHRGLGVMLRSLKRLCVTAEVMPVRVRWVVKWRAGGGGGVVEHERGSEEIERAAELVLRCRRLEKN